MSKLLETLSEIVNWIQIAISPTFIGIVIGALVYWKYPNNYGVVGGVSISVIGLIIGIIWATRIWKTKGTTYFMSRIHATPELDNEDLKKDK